jgi:hypothetical protein
MSATKLTGKEHRAIVDAITEKVKMWVNLDLSVDIERGLNAGLAAAQEPELPPKPEWAVRECSDDNCTGLVWGDHRGTFAVTGECRKVGTDEYFVSNLGLIAYRRGGKDCPWSDTVAWILVKRPDTPPAGYEFTGEFRKPKSGDKGIIFADGSQIIRANGDDVWDCGGEGPIDGWILKPAAPKGALISTEDFYRSGYEQGYRHGVDLTIRYFDNYGLKLKTVQREVLNRMPKPSREAVPPCQK